MKSLHSPHYKMLIIMTLSLSCVSLAFSPMSSFSSVNGVIRRSASSRLFSTSPTSSSSTLESIFDFTTPSPTFTPTHPINKFERIDDAIMGGISTSSLKFIPSQPYSSWSGVCREFGGGFCGMRTLPFVDPLYCSSLNNRNTNGTATDTAGTTSATGMFVKCRLASDDEPYRRVWKMTLRTDSSRGETVYQSQFQLPPSSSSAIDEQQQEEGGEFHTIYIPFTSFQQVRGPRIVPNGPPLNLTNGIYQIGMTMSKFQMGMNTTQIENFRDGFFELQLQQIGFYYDDNNNNKSSTITADNASADQQIIVAVNNNDNNNNTIQTLTKEEMMKKRPLLFKLIIALSKIFFSEQANRRKSAMNILRTKRQMTRVQAITFGLKNRANSIGLFRSVLKTVSIIAIDVFRTILKNVLKVSLVLPLKLVRRGLQGVGLMKKKVSMKE